MAKKEKTELKKGEAKFNFVGRVKINDFTFNMDSESKTSDWVYNQFKLQVDCGEYGVMFCESMGGYGAKRDNVLYVHGNKPSDSGAKDSKGNPIMVDDYKNQFKIDWDDRFNEDVLSQIGQNCFITVGLEKKTDDKTFYKNFLSEYDAIEYIKEHLEDGMIVNIKGNIGYSEYEGNTQGKKPIQSIVLSKVTDEKDFKATFTQTILVDVDSLGKVDKEKKVYPISAYVVDYVGKPQIDGKKVEIKKNAVFTKNFEYAFTDEEKAEKVVGKLFKPKKKDDVWVVTVEGVITRGGTLQTATIDDLPADIQEFIELEVMTLEEALEKCVGSGTKIETYTIKTPKIIKAKEDAPAAISMDKDKYKADDLVFYGALIEEFGGKSESSKATDSKSEDDEEDVDMDALLDGLDD